MAGKADNYRRLSAPEKRELSLRRMREPGVQCPQCETMCGVDDLLGHLATRCNGLREPHPHSRWLTVTQAVELGVARKTLYRWAASERVRTKPGDGGQRFLARDVTRRIADSLTGDTGSKRRPKRRRNRLPKQATRDRAGRMSQALSKALIDRLQAYAGTVGGLAAASRRLDIPTNTLRRAASGQPLRAGTRKLIELQLEETAI